jgi:hypothetical protein
MPNHDSNAEMTFPASHQVAFLGGLTNDSVATVRIDNLVVQFCRWKGSSQHRRKMMLRQLESRRCLYMLPITYLADQHIRLSDFLVKGRQSISGTSVGLMKKIANSGRPYITDVRAANIFHTAHGPVLVDFEIAREKTGKYQRGIELLREIDTPVGPLHALPGDVELLATGQGESDAVVRIDNLVYKLLKPPEDRERHVALQRLKAAESRQHPHINPAWFCAETNVVLSRYVAGRSATQDEAASLRQTLIADGKPYIGDTKYKESTGCNVIVRDDGTAILIDFNVNEPLRDQAATRPTPTGDRPCRIRS